MSADTSTSGPLFDGTADRHLADGIDAIRRDVAAEGVRLTRAAFGQMIRHEGGRFLGSITTTTRSRTFTSDGYSMAVTADLDEDVVTTELVSYGPWLEGDGSRNETTRFKGYHGFRMAAQELEGVAGGIAEKSIGPAVEAMNG